MSTTCLTNSSSSQVSSRDHTMVWDYITLGNIYDTFIYTKVNWGLEGTSDIMVTPKLGGTPLSSERVDTWSTRSEDRSVPYNKVDR